MLEKLKLDERYTQRQVMRLLGKYAKRRSTKKSDTWIPCARLKYIAQLCDQLGV